MNSNFPLFLVASFLALCSCSKHPSSQEGTSPENPKPVNTLPEFLQKFSQFDSSNTEYDDHDFITIGYGNRSFKRTVRIMYDHFKDTGDQIQIFFTMTHVNSQPVRNANYMFLDPAEFGFNLQEDPPHNYYSVIGFSRSDMSKQLAQGEDTELMISFHKAALDKLHYVTDAKHPEHNTNSLYAVVYRKDITGENKFFRMRLFSYCGFETNSLQSGAMNN